MSGRIGPGAFVAVVGASGVGKDTVLFDARGRCQPGVVFPRRSITRPPGPGEDFASLSPSAFDAAADAGAFAVTWRAHGLAYGVPVSIDADVRASRVVVVNVSRAVLDVLAGRFEHLVVVRVTVSDKVRAERLALRNRETVEQITERLARVDPSRSWPVDYEIVNDRSVAEAGTRLAKIVQNAARAPSIS